MNVKIFSLIIGALLPIIITVVLGYISGVRKDFGWEQAGVMNGIVMNYTLPLSLFSGMIVTPRSILLAEGPVAIAIALVLILSLIITLLVIYYIFKRNLAISTLQALAIASPAVPFIGTSVLNFLFPATGAALITISSIIQNVFQLPICLILLSIATGGEKKPLILHIVDALKKPIVWAPILATIFVILDMGYYFPKVLVDSLALLGKATGGLALFAAGIILFSKKITFSLPTIITVILRNIVVPIICLLCVSMLGFSAEEIRETVLTMAIPIGSVGIILAMQFKTGEQEMASSMALSVIFSIITMGLFILVTN